MVEIEAKPKILDIGCGTNKTKDAVGLDIAPLPGVDIVHDLNTFPYPIDDNSFDKILCYSVLEHVDDAMRTIAELHRIMKPNAELHISLPHYSHPKTYADPTHKHFYSFGVVKYFAGEVYPYYAGVKFNIKLAILGQPGHDSLLRGIMNKNPYLTERLLTFIRPVESMYFILQAVK